MAVSPQKSREISSNYHSDEEKEDITLPLKQSLSVHHAQVTVKGRKDGEGNPSQK